MTVDDENTRRTASLSRTTARAKGEPAERIFEEKNGRWDIWIWLLENGDIETLSVTAEDDNTRHTASLSTVIAEATDESAEQLLTTRVLWDI